MLCRESTNAAAQRLLSGKSHFFLLLFLGNSQTEDSAGTSLFFPSYPRFFNIDLWKQDSCHPSALQGLAKTGIGGRKLIGRRYFTVL